MAPSGPKPTVGEVWYAHIPFKEQLEQSKVRPVVVVGMSPAGSGEDEVVLVCSITSFGGGGQAKRGDVAILNWRRFDFASPSWIRARRLYGVDPRALKPPNHGAVKSVDQDVLEQVLGEIGDLFS